MYGVKEGNRGSNEILGILRVCVLEWTSISADSFFFTDIFWMIVLYCELSFQVQVYKAFSDTKWQESLSTFCEKDNYLSFLWIKDNPILTKGIVKRVFWQPYKILDLTTSNFISVGVKSLI